MEDNMNKEEIKKIVREVMIENSKEIALAMWDTPVKDVKEKKEWPQGGDQYWFIDDDGGVCEDDWHNGYAERNKNEYGNVFQTKEEAEAVRDLRKHESKCRFTMDDFKDGEEHWSIEDFDYAKPWQGKPHFITLLEGTMFPTEELAQERADILKRLAKIRNLI
jgi:hypothetical protein